eukprot:3011800-Rhodomonas_salina.3
MDVVREVTHASCRTAEAADRASPRQSKRTSASTSMRDDDGGAGAGAGGEANEMKHLAEVPAKQPTLGVEGT